VRNLSESDVFGNIAIWEYNINTEVVLHIWTGYNCLKKSCPVAGFGTNDVRFSELLAFWTFSIVRYSGK
jgi:hypothetical protein